MVSFEISTYCNRKCWYCPNSYNETLKKFMDWNIFIKAIEELKNIKYSGAISYNLYNEPLFDDRLEDFIRHTHNSLPNVITVLYTNGDILNVELAKKLVEAGLDKFIVTVHDKDPDKNLKRLIPVKEFLKEKMILQTSNDLKLLNQGGTININSSKNKYIVKKCPDIKNLTIKFNGDIILCCRDYYARNIIGNILNNTIVDIYKSYSDLREELLSKNIVKLDICKKCLEIEDDIKPYQN
ncbi:radical SAM protein [Brachyspira hyodysenteriae]|uniref:radical SAM/SPASM domain-containing protein n=1 Tax=Brachyspira hyodysenteriae TaxID=159 RepID=UPI0022CDBB3E|nr:radical SAM/SPASM domain-containing protein [Brachyspira hyodysenteriae]MDA0049030.1 radical SAM protein [Brachyspira hyodysenteriae]